MGEEKEAEEEFLVCQEVSTETDTERKCLGERDTLRDIGTPVLYRSLGPVAVGGPSSRNSCNLGNTTGSAVVSRHRQT